MSDWDRLTPAQQREAWSKYYANLPPQAQKPKPLLSLAQKFAVGSLVFFVVVVVAVALFGDSPESGSRPDSSASPIRSVESDALRIVGDVYGPCLRQIGLHDWQEAAVVKMSTATQGVVTVSISATDIATGADRDYDFRVNTDRGYPGPPEPGTGIPVTSDAVRLVATCE